MISVVKMRSIVSSSTAAASTAIVKVLSHPKRISFNQLLFFSTESVKQRGSDLIGTTQAYTFSDLQRKVLSMIDTDTSPLGSFEDSDFLFLKDYVRKLQKAKRVSADVVALEFRIMDRLIAELKVKESQPSVTSNKTLYPWICNGKFWAPTFEQWRGNSVDPTPMELWQRLRDGAHQLPSFQRVLMRVKSSPLLLILDTAVQRIENKATAAQVAQDVLSTIQAWIRSNHCKRKLGVLLYNRVLEAWAHSGSGTLAQTNIAQLVHEMRNSRKIFPNHRTYDILLRYYSELPTTEYTERLLEETWLHIQQDNLQPSLSNLVIAIKGFSKTGSIDRAENLLECCKAKVLGSSGQDSQPQNLDVTSLLISTRFLISAYAKKISQAVKKNDLVPIGCLLERARELYDQILAICMTFDEKKQRQQQLYVAKLAASMMYCYAAAEQPKAMEKVIAELLQHCYPMNASAYNRIIKPLGRHDHADRATAVLKHLLRNSNFTPALSTFNVVLDAWTRSSRPDSFEHATHVFEMLSDHPKCQELRPDTDSYLALLMCLARAEGKLRRKSGKIAVKLMKEIQGAANNDSLCLNRRCYNLVVKACLRSNDECSAWKVIKRMEKTENSKPNIRTYNEIMYFFSKKGTLQAARKADELLYDLAKKAKTTTSQNESAIIPNVHSYLAVANAWAKADCLYSARRLINLYKHMKEFKKPLHQHIYVAIIRYLAGDSLQSSVRSADKILRDMEQDVKSDNKPDYRHYMPVLRGYMFKSKMRKATSVLVRSAKAYIQTKNRSVAPSSAMVDMVIQGWLRHDNIVKASQIANQMARLKMAGKIPEGPDQSVLRALLSQWTNFQLVHPERIKFIRLLETRLEEVMQRERLVAMKNFQRGSLTVVEN